MAKTPSPVAHRSPTRIDRLNDRIIELEGALAKAREEKGDAYRQLVAANAQSEAVRKENDYLRDQLHEMSVEKARLEGYIDRARESDPLPAPEMIPVPPMQRVYDGYGAMGATGERPAPWYRRSR